MQEKKYAIRFGLGAIKAVGLKAMQNAAQTRKDEGEFKDVFDFAKKMDAKSVNKKSVEALAKSGAFDNIADNRRQIFESFNIISSYAVQQENEANSNQMTFFGELIDEAKSKPDLKKVEDWDKVERLKKEFDAFGFFLNEHPLDDSVEDLKRRGVIFCDKTDMGEVGDAFIVKMAGVVASSKHRSGPRGRFAYMTISDPVGIYEVMVFDEALITRARDLLADGSSIVMESLIRKDEGGTRIMIREVQASDEFLRTASAKDEPFEDIKQLPKRKNFDKNKQNQGEKKEWKKNNFSKEKTSAFGAAPNYQEQQKQKLEAKEIIAQIKISIEKREAIFDVKSFLSRRLAPPNFEKTTAVKIDVNGVQIELPQKYILDDGDIKKLRQVEGVEGAEAL